jgi:hypothetical protein
MRLFPCSRAGVGQLLRELGALVDPSFGGWARLSFYSDVRNPIFGISVETAP